MPSAPDPAPRTSRRDPATPPLDAPSQDEHILGRDLREWRSLAGRVLVRALGAAELFLERAWRGWSLQLTVALVFLVGGGLVSWLVDGAADVYEDVVGHEGLAALDRPVLDWAVSTRTPDGSRWVTNFTHVGGPVGGTVLAVVVLAALVAAWRRWTPVVVMVPALVGALLVTLVGKDLTGRARPDRALAVPPFESSASFPSGHALNATVLAGTAAYLLLIATRRVWLGALGVAAAAGYALTMGLSRVWLGHHWLTDVVAGWLLGLAWVVGVVTVHRLWLTLRRDD